VWQEDSLDSLDKVELLFTGKQVDAETGWYNFGARYLDPKTGIWLSSDPALGEYIPRAPLTKEDKEANGKLPGNGGIYNPVNFALYHFAGNNPIRYTDPDGRAIPAAVYVAMAYLNSVAAAPDTQTDIRLLSEDLAQGDYVSAAFDAVGMAVPGLTNTGALSKAAEKFIAEHGEGVAKSMMVELRKLGADIHHLFTDKNTAGGFTSKFEKLLAGAGLSLQSKENKLPLLGHRGNGAHSEKYWGGLLNRANDAVAGLKPGTKEFADKLTNFLKQEAENLTKDPAQLYERS